MEPVAIVDSGGANIASLRYALERLGVAARLTSDPLELRAAPRVILPGVGRRGRRHAAPAHPGPRRAAADADPAGARHLSRHAIALSRRAPRTTVVLPRV